MGNARNYVFIDSIKKKIANRDQAEKQINDLLKQRNITNNLPIDQVDFSKFKVQS